MSTLSPHELFLQTMRFECPGRTLATLGGIWPSTINRWIGEGMPPELKDMPRMLEYFDLDPHLWTAPAADLFVYPPFEREVVRETDDKVTYVNRQGITCTEFKEDAFTSMPHFESFPVRDRGDWESFRERLRWDDGRIREDWTEQKAEWRERDVPLILFMGRGASLYGSLRDMVGMESLSLMFYDDPGLVHEMMDAMVDLFIEAVDHLFTDFQPDAVCLWEDMAYKAGPLLSPPLVEEFMIPRYRRMTAAVREKDIPFIFLDSDGDITQLIPLWLEAGIDGVVPMEAQAGMNVADARRDYPELLIMGGVDKKALARGRDAIDEETEKVQRTVDAGGYVPFFDHGLPHDVSYEDFCYFVDKLKAVTR